MISNSSSRSPTRMLANSGGSLLPALTSATTSSERSTISFSTSCATTIPPAVWHAFFRVSSGTTSSGSAFFSPSASASPASADASAAALASASLNACSSSWYFSQAALFFSYAFVRGASCFSVSATPFALVVGIPSSSKSLYFFLSFGFWKKSMGSTQFFGFTGSFGPMAFPFFLGSDFPAFPTFTPSQISASPVAKTMRVLITKSSMLP
mmetsp:Transcript_62531/g.174321  ORF Transcript_62531/g.174321 Transcript_62531/m.174321 type:complete len:210 (+) Transcript_62531:683-1312(+)